MDSSTKGQKPVSPAQIAHFGIRTRPENFEKMLQWHLNFFNASIVLKGGFFALIRWDDEHHRMVIIADKDHEPAPNKRSACGIYHISFTLPTINSLADSYEQKAAHGILPHWPVNHGISTSMYYFDPDGNEFEMQIDNFDTSEEAIEFMKTPEFVENSVGVDIPILEWLQRVRDGEDEKILKRRPKVGPRNARWQNSIYFEQDPSSDSPHAVRRLDMPGVAKVH